MKNPATQSLASEKSDAAPLKALVLAAGKGTRLQAEGIDLPKVMRLANGKPLLHYVLKALDFLPPKDIILVVGWKKDAVLSAFPPYFHVVQEILNGTGGAIQFAAPMLQGYDGQVLICCGDAPLMRRGTFLSLVETHLRQGNACTILSARLENGGNYGRVLREADGSFRGIVEARDCTPAQAAIAEVNTGAYLFHAPQLLSVLGELQADNAQRELYLTDVPALLKQRGARVGLCDTCSPIEMLGVNTPEQLAEVEAILCRSCLKSSG
jgi:bifunctional N-acetylglucosamine-1-phosphate-uridyltransferase/glucosamine-1-phosphate-acetyltransferase GlmU-like protein